MKINEVNPEHNLYLIKVYGERFNLIKFGYSSKIKERLSQYYNHNPLIEIVGTYYREDGIEFENKLHKIIQSEIGNEWYLESKLDLILKYIHTDIPNNIPFTYTSGGRSTIPKMPYIEGEGKIRKAIRQKLFNSIDWSK